MPTLLVLCFVTATAMTFVGIWNKSRALMPGIGLSGMVVPLVGKYVHE